MAAKIAAVNAVQATYLVIVGASRASVCYTNARVADVNNEQLNQPNVNSRYNFDRRYQAEYLCLLGGVFCFFCLLRGVANRINRINRMNLRDYYIYSIFFFYSDSLPHTNTHNIFV